MEERRLYERAKSKYEEEGFCFSSRIFDEKSIARAIMHQDLVISGQYETGIAPRRPFDKSQASTGAIVKIDSSKETLSNFTKKFSTESNKDNPDYTKKLEELKILDQMMTYLILSIIR